MSAPVYESAELPDGDGVVRAGDVIVVSDHDLYGLRRHDGTLLWHYLPSGARRTGIFAPAVSGDTLFTASASGHVVALDARTGRELWVATLASSRSVTVFTPVVADGRVYASFNDFGIPGVQGGIAAIELDGTVRWRRMLDAAAGYGSFVLAPVAVDAGAERLLVTNVGDGTVIAADRASGATRWISPRLPEVPPGSPDLRPVTACEGPALYVGSTSGRAVRLDPRDGHIVWRGWAERGSLSLRLQCDARLLYGIHPYGQLAAFDAATGAVAWRMELGESDGFSQAALPADGVLYLGSRRGVWALSTR